MAARKAGAKAATPGRHALLIAIDCYIKNATPEGSYGSLKGCVRDVGHVEEYLRKSLKMTDAQIVKLTSTNTGAPRPPEPKEGWPTYANMVGAFQGLIGRVKKGDHVYIHYSGHGGRCATILPDVKGADALDESLVPMDIGQKGARYLRDVELAHLLAQLDKAGAVVTVVLDSCHSGGATRGLARGAADVGDVAVRGVDFVDRRPPPKDSLVGSLDELRSTYGRRLDRATPATRGLDAGSGWVPGVDGFVLLAACRPQELAYEAAFDGGERNGALTYCLLEALRQFGPGATYQTIYDRVLGRVHTLFEQQTPLLQGDAARLFFGADGRVEAPPAAAVLAVEDGGKRVQIQAGQASGVRKGASFAIYPAGTTGREPKDRRALVEVVEPGAAESWAEVRQSFGKRPVEPGDQAVLVSVGSTKLVRRARFVRRDGKPAGPRDAALKAAAQAIEGNGWVDKAGAGEPADFVVTLDDAGKAFELRDRAGLPIANLRPPLATADPGSAAAVAERLVHLARFRAVQELANHDDQSSLAGKVAARLIGVMDDYQRGDAIEPKPLPPGPPTLKAGQTAFLEVRNDSTQTLNVAVLALQSDWSIIQVVPRDREDRDFVPLDAGHALPPIALTAGLPEGSAEARDVLKVFATVGPARFRTLCLPPLDRPIASRGATRGAPAGGLDALLNAVAADQPPTRNVVGPAAASEEWATVQIEVRTIKL